MASVAAYGAAVVLANVMTARMGLVPVGFGLMVTAGTYAAGFALLARDFVHRYGGPRWAFAAIAVAGVASWAMSTPALAVASVLAFTVAELADLAVYAPLRKRGFVRASAASNVVGAPIDTVIFLSVAGFGLAWPVVVGQLIGKLLWATALPLLAYAGVRHAVSRESVNAKGA